MFSQEKMAGPEFQALIEAYQRIAGIRQELREAKPDSDQIEFFNRIADDLWRRACAAAAA